MVNRIDSSFLVLTLLRDTSFWEVVKTMREAVVVDRHRLACMLHNGEVQRRQINSATSQTVFVRPLA